MDTATIERVEPGAKRAVTAKSERKREALIRAATRVINARTYALATMTEIAAALDLRDATLYYYFPSKQALAFACHLKSMERFEAFLVTAEAAGGSGQAKLARFLFELIEGSRTDGPLLYFGDYFHLEPPQRAAITAQSARLTTVLEAMVEGGVRDGSIAPCESALVVQLLLGMLIWLAKWVDTIPGLTAERLLAAIGMMTVKGLAPR